jgi:hypothetical protein
MTTEIVKATVEIVPRPNLEGVETAITKLSVETEKLPVLKEKADALIAKGPLNWTADDCQAAKLLELDVRTVKKQAGLLLDPYWEVVKTASNKLSDYYKGHEDPADAIDKQLQANVKIFEAEEKMRAQRETDRQNRERLAAAEKKAKEEREDRERKAKEEKDKKIKEINAGLKRGDIGKREAAKMLREAGAYAEAAIEQAAADTEASVQAVKDNPVTVKADVRPVAGVPSRTNYKAELKDFDQLLYAYVATFAKPINMERRLYLRRFIMANEQKVGEEARDTKDSKKMSAAIPGFRFYED